MRLIDLDNLKHELEEDTKQNCWHDNSGRIYDAVMEYIEEAPLLDIPFDKTCDNCKNNNSYLCGIYPCVDCENQKQCEEMLRTCRQCVEIDKWEWRGAE